MLDSYCLLLQKTGSALTGDLIENIFYNAAQGSRNPDHSCIAYLKTDNSYEMLGTKNGEIEPDRKQTRYKYSPAHQDVAVCCTPNAGRISPYFIQNSWMKENETTLAAVLLMPNIVETKLGAETIRIETITDYPADNSFVFKVNLPNPVKFKLKIRKPGWANKIVTAEKLTIKDNFIVIERLFASGDEVKIKFETDVQIKSDNSGDHYFTYGALLFAKPIEAEETAGKIYAGNFADYTYKPVSPTQYNFVNSKTTKYTDGKIITELINKKTGKKEKVELVPLGKTILRQTTF